MVNLLKTPAFSEPLALSGAGVQVTGLPDRSMALASAGVLKTAGMDAPENGHYLDAGDQRIQWFDHAHYLVIGGAGATQPGMTDQSDGWVGAHITGPGARDVLARLCPLDLRDGVFDPGQTARSLIGHMSAVITRTGPEAFEIMVFRSMADTLAHDLTRAVNHLRARAE